MFYHEVFDDNLLRQMDTEFVVWKRFLGDFEAKEYFGILFKSNECGGRHEVAEFCFYGCSISEIDKAINIQTNIYPCPRVINSTSEQAGGLLGMVSIQFCEY